MLGKVLAPLVVALVSIFATACEGYRCAVGEVRDAATGLPLDSVYCDVVTDSEDFDLTDSTGYFDVCNEFGSCTPKCKDIQVEFSKSGYQSTSIENPEDTVTVYLTR